MDRALPTDPRWFREVLGQYPTGVCVVTATEGTGTQAGFVVGSFTSVSLDPPLIAFYPDKSSTTWPRIKDAGRFCVNILSADQEPICRRFASKGLDKFAGVVTARTPSGSPIIEGVVAWIDCELAEVQDAGDHFAVYGRVLDMNVEIGTLPLLFFQGGYGRFAPLSMAAPESRSVSAERLRQLDLIRAEMEALASDLSARCVATTVAADSLVVLGSAGSPGSVGLPTLVGVELPFVPPTGNAIAAWYGEREVEKWLSGVVDDRHRSEHHLRLRTVAARGYSLGLLNEAQREYASLLDRLAIDPVAVDATSLRDLAARLCYDPADDTVESRQDVRVIAVPVFDAVSRPALAITVYGFDHPRAQGGIDHYIARAVEASRRATGLLGGQLPASLASV